VPDLDSYADFSALGDIEFENAAALFSWCELGRKVASNSGLILVQGAYDIYQALATIPPPYEGRLRRSPQQRARRVARHARRASEHLHAAQASLARLPRAYLDEYQDVISARRPRQQFDPRKGV
jgi:hypothetical protein